MPLLLKSRPEVRRICGCMDSVTCIGFSEAELAESEARNRIVLERSACPKHNGLNDARALEDIERMAEERNKKGRTRCDGPHS